MGVRLPVSFKPLLWSYDFTKVDPERDRKIIIVNAINYGTLAQWRWIIRYYGKKEVVAVLQQSPAAALKPRARRLAGILLNINQFNHALQGTHAGR